MKSISTPEEAAAFAQEILAPMIMGLQRPAPEAQEEKAERPERAVHRRAPASLSFDGETPHPWYDLVSNDNEALIIDLYAKGMTTRDIAIHMKSLYGFEMSQPNIFSISDTVRPLINMVGSAVA